MNIRRHIIELSLCVLSYGVLAIAFQSPPAPSFAEMVIRGVAVGFVAALWQFVGSKRREP